MQQSSSLRIRRLPSQGLFLAAVSAYGAMGAAQAQVQTAVFSIEYHGPTVGASGPQGLLYSEGDLLLQTMETLRLGPAQQPLRLLDGGSLGLPNYNQCFAAGHGPGDPCGIELDALSFGQDYPIRGLANETFYFRFSVEERADAGPGLQSEPSIATEASSGDISSDVWTSRQLPPPPLQVGVFFGDHLGLLDGNGTPATQGFPGVYPGLGLVEPNRVGFGLPTFPSDEGDNLDALDTGRFIDPSVEALYFSVDGDLPSGGALGSGTAATLNALAADVLQRFPSGQIVRYASAQSLGLSAADDLDALVLWENGVPGFQPSSAAYDWAGLGPPTDMLLFSVREGSAIVGLQDSLQMQPIEPGDVLMPPVNGLGNPAIFVPAEALGLQTARGGGEPAELDGLDLEDMAFKDCQGNGIEDADDIGSGFSDDDNMNSIPDECEEPGVRFCECSLASAPCSNSSLDAGCVNSTGLGGAMDGAGSSSIFANDFSLDLSQLPPGQSAQVFMGSDALVLPAPLGDGLRCVGGGTLGLQRFQPVFNTGTGSTSVTGLIDYSCLFLPPAACIVTGSTWYFQAWYRDPGGPCSNGSNLTNGVAVSFTL